MPRAAKSPLSPRKEPRQQRAQATVEALLVATARVLVVRGWAGTTTNHIAKRAGVSIGTLYEYFPSKDALVNALIERHLQEAEGRLGQLAAQLMGGVGSLQDLVRAIVTAMVELHAAAPRLHQLLFEEVPHSPSVRRRIRNMEDSHAETLAQLLPRFVALTDPHVTARVVVELLEALTHRWVLAKDAVPVPRARMQQELERLVLAYLRAS